MSPEEDHAFRTVERHHHLKERRTAMAIEKNRDFELDERALEASLPTLTDKLRQLQDGLSDDERAVFSSIVNSAALHLEQMQAISNTAEIRYMKPISAAATANVRQHLLQLPDELGLNQ